MKQLIDSYSQSQNLHHAYLIEGDCQSCVQDISDFFDTHTDEKIKGNPNFVIEERDTFLIGDARRLRELQLNKTQKDARKIFIMSFNFITREAQNALLKVLEEPTAGTHIFLVTPRKHIFLPTVLSRVDVIQQDGVDGDSNLTKEVGEFISSSYKDRMKIITKLVKAIKDEKKSKADALLFVESIIFASERQLQEKADANIAKKISRLQKTHSYMQDQGASVKMLLEQTALIV